MNKQGPLLTLGLLPNDLLSLFPEHTIFITSEFENDRWKVETVSYRDGMQNFIGPTRDYRGETFILDKNENRYHLLRGSLPVFPEYNHIEKDEKTQKVIMDKTTKFKVMPKFDGSLFNLTYIPGDIFSGIFNNNGVSCAKGRLFFGSKNRFHAGQNMYDRIVKSILGSYETVEKFINHVANFICKYNLENTSVTLHFEAIHGEPSEELSVVYDKPMCPFLGYTVFTDIAKTFKLPIGCDFPCASVIKTFSEWEDVLGHVNENYNLLKSGDMSIEPEGYVVHAYNGDGEWYPVKLKYDFYYMAHKPDSRYHKDKVKSFVQDSENTFLCKRMLKLRNYRTAEELSQPIIESFVNTIPEEVRRLGRKEWAIYWNAKKDILNDIGQTLENTLVENTHGYVVGRLKQKMFSTMMKCHTDLESISKILFENI